MTNIPSDEEFERASQLMEMRSRGLDEVRESVKRYFAVQCPLNEVFILPQRDVDFRSYVFFEKNDDIENGKRNRVVQSIEDFVYQELERVGRGKREKLSVVFEWDFYENVVANFEGDYFLRLR